MLVLLAVTAVVAAGSDQGKAVQFLAVGDWGGGSRTPFCHPREMATAAAMGRVVEERGADFVLALGDNFYYDGVRDEWDPRFQETFERVFTAPGLRDLPWFVLAGNHDHHGNVSAQLAYSRHSERWHFPHHYYSLRLRVPGTNATARLLVLDTVLLCGSTDDFGVGATPGGPADAAAAEAQLSWLRGRLVAARHDLYVLVAGHYPVWSVAEHGPTTCLLRLLRPLLRQHHVTAYLCGHDHNLQFLKEDGIGYVVSGAGNFMEASQIHKAAVPPGVARFFLGLQNHPEVSFISVSTPLQPPSLSWKPPGAFCTTWHYRPVTFDHT